MIVVVHDRFKHASWCLDYLWTVGVGRDDVNFKVEIMKGPQGEVENWGRFGRMRFGVGGRTKEMQLAA